MKTIEQSLTEFPEVQRMIALALEEDIGTGDATTLALVDPKLRAEALLLAKEACVVAGGDVGASVFRSVDPDVEVDVVIEDGHHASAGDVILRLRGRAGALMTAERTALNFMQRMCGIATQTSLFVAALPARQCVILDTRKTTPGLRHFEKYAVRCGGGTNHRFGLYDKIMIKDNHRFLWKGHAGGNLGEAVQQVRTRYPDLEIEIEVESLDELKNAMEGCPDWVLLDNMSPEEMAACVAWVKGRCRLEASGGITLETLAEVAKSGVDAISLGCLTHSVRSVDLSLEMVNL